MLSPSALLALPSAQQTAPAFDCAHNAGTWTGWGLLSQFWGGEGGRKVGDEAAWWLLPAPCIKGTCLHLLGIGSGLGLWSQMDLYRWHSLPWSGGISGHGRQDPASMLTQGQEPDKPSSTSNLCQREQTGGESLPKAPRAVELQNIHPGVVLEGPWGLLKPEGTRQWRIYGSTNAVLAPAACWLPLIGLHGSNYRDFDKRSSQNFQMPEPPLAFKSPQALQLLPSLPGVVSTAWSASPPWCWMRPTYLWHCFLG